MRRYLTKKGGVMSKDELIDHIEKYDTPHNRALLRQYSRARLEEYLEYLQRMSAPRELERIAG